MRLILTASILVFVGLFQGCHYLPYLKYRQGKDGEFPKFSEKWTFAGSENSYRTCYDITHYDWSIFPDPKKKKLTGNMIISYTAMEVQDTLLLDLQNKMNVEYVRSSAPLKKYKHKDNLLYIVLESPLSIGEQHNLVIAYSGKVPNVAGQGPVFWKKDANDHPFIGTLTQGIGPHFIMPCKDLLYDEADSCIIRVEASNELVAVANGKLFDISPSENGRVFSYRVRNSINVYNISYNVGDYVTFVYPYTDVTGEDRSIEAVVLREDSAKAYQFYTQTPMIMRELEGLFGGFPWWNDGCRFLETAISGGAMEHQSAISMGRILKNDWVADSILPTNGTLIHELAHEWWGNSITARDYGDAWLHEGMASYIEALVPERLYGKWAYELDMKRTLSRINNERMVIKPFGVRYNSWAYGPDGNIYNKGAAFMHTLRMQMNNDSLFFAMYKAAYQEFAYSEITTSQLENFFNTYSAMNLSPYFQAYLRQAEPPTLQYYLNDSKTEFNYRFKQGIPEDFQMRVLLGEEPNVLSLYPTVEYQTVRVDTTNRVVPLERFGYIILEKDLTENGSKTPKK